MSAAIMDHRQLIISDAEYQYDSNNNQATAT